MLVRALVSGVRSSCEASATRRRWERAESSSASSIVLNAEASRESSSLPVASIRRDRSRVVLTSSATPVSRRTGAIDRPRHEQAEQGGEADTRRRDHEQPAADASQCTVDLVQRPRDLQGVPPLQRQRVDPACACLPRCGRRRTHLSYRLLPPGRGRSRAARRSRPARGSSSPADVTSCVYPAAPPSSGGGMSRYSVPDGVSPIRRRRDRRRRAGAARRRPGFAARPARRRT